MATLILLVLFRSCKSQATLYLSVVCLADLDARTFFEIFFWMASDWPTGYGRQAEKWLFRCWRSSKKKGRRRRQTNQIMINFWSRTNMVEVDRNLNLSSAQLSGEKGKNRKTTDRQADRQRSSSSSRFHQPTSMIWWRHSGQLEIPFLTW